MDHIQGYLTTTYTLEGGSQTIGLRIGVESAQAQAWMAAGGVSRLAFISAENPRSEVLTKQENAERMQQMAERLRESNLRFWPAAGVPDSTDWEVERAFFVECDLAAALRLAAEFEQNAIVMVESGLCPALVICRNLVTSG